MRRLKLPCDDITPIGLWGSDMYLIGVNNDQFEVLRLWNVQTEDVTPATLRDLHTDSPAIPTSPSAGNAASGARSSARGASSAAPATTPSSADVAAPARPARSDREVAIHQPDPSVGLIGNAELERETASSYLPDPGAAQGRAPLEVQPAFEAVAMAPAPEAPSVRPSSTGARPEMRVENGATAAPNVSLVGDRRDGPDLKLEPTAASAARSSVTEERRPAKGGKAEKAREAAKESASRDSSNAGKLRMTVDGEHLYAEIKGGKIVLKDRTYDSLAHARDSIRRERNKVAVWEYFDEGVKAWRVLNRD